MAETAVRYELRGVCKYFAKVVANQDVSFAIEPGQVLAILGENGAGKSTIMKVLFGLYDLDAGQILRDGRPITIGSPRDAIALGVSMVQQHYSLVGAHTVLENVILGAVHGRIDYAARRADVEAVAQRFGLRVPLDDLVRDLPVGVQQKVEILKALYQNASLLILDEPTAVLTPEEADALMAFLRTFVEEGNSVVFITHKLREVMRVADRIVVMRAGRVTGDLATSDTDEHQLAGLMIGHDLVSVVNPRADRRPGDSGLQVRDVSLVRDGVQVLRELNLDIGKGEILGIAGVSGNGQEDLCEVLIGRTAPTSGSVTFAGRDLSGESVRERIDAGFGYVPADRLRDGLIGALSIAENVLLKQSIDGTWGRGPAVDRKRLGAFTEGILAAYEVKASGPDALVGTLSGGNQQKVVLGRESELAKELVILNQPTRGLDLGAINYVHRTILGLKEQGRAVLLISTELSEIFALADRIGVIYEGHIDRIYPAGQIDQQQVGRLMAGLPSPGPTREQERS